MRVPISCMDPARQCCPASTATPYALSACNSWISAFSPSHDGGADDQAANGQTSARAQLICENTVHIGGA